jgi:hypothetical protein
VPRTSYNQVRRVGERQYGNAGGAGAGGGYGYPPQAQTQQYAQQPPPQQQEPGGRRSDRGGSGGGPNNKGLLIGAVAVVAVVAIIIVAVMANGSGKTDTAGGSASTAPSTGSASSAQPSASASSPSADDKAGALPGTVDAANLSPAGGAVVGSSVKGAKASGGKYVGMQAVGSSVTWTFNAPKAGWYTLYVDYGVPGADATSALAVNGVKNTQPLGLKNYSNAAAGDWEKGWTNTYAFITLKKGQNTVQISCDAGDQCNFYLDQLSLKAGQVTS